MQGFLNDGTIIYAEHINHNPPMDAILMENKEFRLHTTITFDSGSPGNTTQVNFRGLVVIEM